MSEIVRRPPYLRLVVSNPPRPDPEPEPEIAFEPGDDGGGLAGVEESPYSALLHGDLSPDLRQQALFSLWGGDGILWGDCGDELYPAALREAARQDVVVERRKETDPSRQD